MLPARVIPVLLLSDGGAVKTLKFNEWKYIGDPGNAARIYSDSEVDELIVLDIDASKQEKEPDYAWLEEISSEAFMPLCYGGGVRNISQMKTLFRLGLEKISINTGLVRQPGLLREASDLFGNQALVASLDIIEERGQFFCQFVGQQRIELGKMLDYAQSNGAGELLVTSISRDGTQTGYDLQLIHYLAKRVSIPWIVNGGAGSLEHLREAYRCGAPALAAGSLFVFQGRHQAVLINYPSRDQLEALFQA